MDLPRDAELCIIKKMDIDTRIKAGIIFKLRIPDDIKKKISKICKPPRTVINYLTGQELYIERAVGLIREIMFLEKKEMYSIKYNILIEYDFVSRWEVMHITDQEDLDTYKLEDNTWKLVD